MRPRGRAGGTLRDRVRRAGRTDAVGRGVRTYAEAGLGPRAGRAVAWCFLAGVITGAPIVSVVGANFLVVYLGCTAAAVRVLRGLPRLAAALSLVAVVVVLAFNGWALIPAAAVAALAATDLTASRTTPAPAEPEWDRVT